MASESVTGANSKVAALSEQRKVPLEYQVRKRNILVSSLPMFSFFIYDFPFLIFMLYRWIWAVMPRRCVVSLLSQLEIV